VGDEAPRPDGERQGRPRLLPIVGSLALAAPLAIALIAFVSNLGGGESKPDASLVEEDRPVASELVSSSRYNLSAGLLAANRDYDDEWSDRIRADPTDRLAFALSLKNEAPVTSYPLVLWTDVEQDAAPPYGYLVRIAVAHPDGTVLVNSPWVHVRVWTNQFGALWVNTQKGGVTGRVFDESGELVRTVKRELGSIPYIVPVELRNHEDGFGHLPIGRLESGRQALVEFEAEWELKGKAEFGTYDPSFGIEGETDSEAFNTGNVEASDVLHFTALLDNQGTVTTSGHLRVEFRPHQGGRYIKMRLLGSLLDDEYLIGTATINSADGHPIALVPQPGSTELWSHPHGEWIYEEDCPISSAPIAKRKLPDGITLGGVEIGDFGGFNPHGNCAGIEFNKQLHFKAAVMAKGSGGREG
jgi:hypothetical protein